VSLERGPTTNLVDVLDRVLDKGIVLDGVQTIVIPALSLPPEEPPPFPPVLPSGGSSGAAPISPAATLDTDQRPRRVPPRDGFSVN
jgi:hypothetical protein